jgi:hypothetical protein
MASPLDPFGSEDIVADVAFECLAIDVGGGEDDIRDVGLSRGAPRQTVGRRDGGDDQPGAQ